ncbi:MAG TPA: small ribosomal subunit Rsm22 family protein [Dongiaceae bacterium]|nr:small ribosomal subunit Rsm22 family protein [Dongiaceae bacterium]
MQLPPSLREAIDRELEGVSLRDLARASETLSQRYRAEVQDGRLHLGDELAARAYLTTRLPATFAAISSALGAAAEARPDFAPRTLLDAGAGPGTATWAAAQHWSCLQDAVLIEASPAIRAVGERLGQALPLERTNWIAGRLDATLSDLTPRDLVLIAYVLDELPPAAREPLIAQLWHLTADTLLIVEPGTTEGWKRILHARDILIRAGAYLLAPCPHAHACPLIAPDWCHFSARLARSRLHREAKGGTVPWEDEKFIYLAASRQPGVQPAARVIAPPRVSKAIITLKLCQQDGYAADRTFAKRSGESFKTARKLDWGDILQRD